MSFSACINLTNEYDAHLPAEIGGQLVSFNQHNYTLPIKPIQQSTLTGTQQGNPQRDSMKGLIKVQR